MTPDEEYEYLKLMEQASRGQPHDQPLWRNLAGGAAEGVLSPFRAVKSTLEVLGAPKGGEDSIDKALTSLDLRPHTKADQTVQKLVGAVTDPVNAVGGGLSGPVGNFVKNAITNEGATLGATMGANAIPGQEGFGGLAGGILGGLVGHMTHTPPLFDPVWNVPKKAPAIAGKVLGLDTRHPVSEEAVMKAAQGMREMQDMGLDTNLGQHMPRTNVAEKYKELAASMNGPETTNTLQRQPNQLNDLAHGTLEGLPGQSGDWQLKANAAADVLQGQLAREKSVASRLFREKAPFDVQMPGEALSSAVQKLERLKKAYPTSPMAQSYIDDVIDSFQKSGPKAVETGIFAPNGLPVRQQLPAEWHSTNPVEIHSGVEEALNGMGKNAMNTPNIGKLGNKVANEVRDIMEGTFEGTGLGEASRAMRQHYRDVVNPLHELISPLIGQAGVGETRNAGSGFFNTLFSKGAPTTDDLNRLDLVMGHLSKSREGTAALADLFKTHLNDKVAEALKNTNTDELAYGTGKALTSVFGTPDTPQGQRNLKVLETIWKGQGRSPEDVQNAVTGFNRMQRAFSVSGNVPPVVGNIPKGDIKNRLEGSAPEEVAKASSTGLGWAAQSLSRITGWTRAERYLDQIMNDPDMVKELIRLGKASTLGPKLLDTLKEGTIISRGVERGRDQEYGRGRPGNMNQ